MTFRALKRSPGLSEGQDTVGLCGNCPPADICDLESEAHHPTRFAVDLNWQSRPVLSFFVFVDGKRLPIAQIESVAVNNGFFAAWPMHFDRLNRMIHVRADPQQA